jgi:type IV secretion system protein VirB10
MSHSPASTTEQHVVVDRDGNRDGDNPYARSDTSPILDLDANAPTLRSNDQQRLNRKALMFLSGIIALLVVMAIWMFNSATASDDPLAKPRDERVVIPEPPEDPRIFPSKTDPIEVVSGPATSADLPPLPAEPPRMSPPTHPQPEFTGPTVYEPSLRERRMGYRDEASGPAIPQGGYAQAMLASMAGQDVKAEQPVSMPPGMDSAQYTNNPDALLVRGTYVRCVLETRIVTDIPGFTACVVTEPVYSINGRNLLLPKGSKVSGRYDIEPNGPRVSVIWDRITTPNGIDVSMASPGIDNLGGAGHPGDYDAHWGARIGAALMISLLGDAFKYAAAQNGPPATQIGNGYLSQTPYESSTARTMERLANQALDKGMSRRATVTINQGTVVNIYVARDVSFAAVLARQ